jgi:lipopolysaccharide/colanic/teichoic acid biosynthesis glycosyltransferase
MTLSVLASLFSVLLVRWISEPIPGFTRLVAVYLAASLFFTLTGIIVSGSYKVVSRYISFRLSERLICAIGIKAAGMVALALVDMRPIHAYALKIMAISVDTLLTAAFLFYPRMAASLMRKEEKAVSSIGKMTALVWGTSHESVDLANKTDSDGNMNVLGFITNDSAMEGKVIGNRIVYLADPDGGIESLQWRLGGVDCVLYPKGAEGKYHAKHGSETSSSMSATDSGHMAAQVRQADGMSLFGHVFKRTFDIVLSSALLVVFSPVMLICAIAVRREDGGPAIYSQERIGRGGRPFMIHKFRSMRMDAESAGAPQLYSGDRDPRLTKVGYFLRAHHLDELPQLWNVLKGDMSFIGYRPERQFYIDRIMECNPRYRYLYQIRPGVTSYATLYNGYTDTLDKMLTRLDLDLYYLRNHSVLFDARVLGMTFLSIVTGKKF